MTMPATRLLRGFLARCALVQAAFFALMVSVPGQESPQIVSVQPPNGAMNVPLNTPVVITFSTQMSTTISRAQFVNILAFPPQLLTMQTSWSADATQMTNTPASPYAPMTQIQWQFVAAQDAGGQALTGLRGGTFFTGQISETPPRLLGTDPPNQATNVAQNAQVSFTFNVAMNKSATRARFFDVTAITNEVAVSSSWDADAKLLTCMPVTNFPPGTAVVWHLEGSDAQGNIFPGAGGGFTTAGMRETNTIIAVISSGEAFSQVDTNLFEIEGQQFLAVAKSFPKTGVAVAAPSSRTNLLTLRDKVGAIEYVDIGSEPAFFSADYPMGEYQLLVRKQGRELVAPVQLTSGALPLSPRIEAWRSPAYVVEGQPLEIAWTIAPGGAPVDYLRLRITRGGDVLFATPLPGEAGALTSASNVVVVPASAFASAGLAQVSLTAFSFTGGNTNSTPEVSVYAAVHRSTVYDLRIVSGTTLPPTLARTNIEALPMDEPLLTPLTSRNGVRPIRYRVLNGQLPPGVTLGASGVLSGTATSEGVFNSTVELTDLLGRSVTQDVRIATVPLPAGSTPPRLENAVVTSEGFTLELVDPTALKTVLENSTDLAQWTPCYTNTAAAKRATVRVPAGEKAMFVRARAAEIYPPRPSANPLTVNPVLNRNVTASATFSDWGGTLSLTNAKGFVFTLTVPPTALSRTENITMTEVSQVGGLPLSGGLIAAVDLQPEGLLFQRSVRLDIAAPTPIELRTLVGFNAGNAGTRFGLQPSFLTNYTISLHLRHFTMAGAGSGTSGDTAGQMHNPPDGGEKQSDQEVADEMARCRMDPNCDINSEEEKNRLRDIFVRQADQVILPKLRDAVADESAIENAIIGWLSWLRQMALVVYDGDSFNPQGNGGLETRMQLAENLAGRALQNGIQKNCDLCLKKDVGRIARVVTFSRWAALLGFDAGDEPFACMQKCLKFELKIESTIYSRDGGQDRTVGTITSAEVNVKPREIDGSSDILTLEGSGEWRIDDTAEVKMPQGCTMSVAGTSGTAEVVLLRISLYRAESYSTDEGELVTYVWDPQVRLSIKADRGQMPKEGRMITCVDIVAVDVADVFAPGFLAFHDDEIENPEAGSLAEGLLGGPAITIEEFVDGTSAGVFLEKVYVREQTLKDGAYVAEATSIRLLHKP